MSSEINLIGQAVGLPVSNWQPPSVPVDRTLLGRYCSLEPLDANRHAADLFAANKLDSDDRIWTYLPYGPFGSFEDYHDFLCSFIGKSDPFFYAIVDAKTQKAVGIASYLRIDPKNGAIEVGHINFSPLLQKSCAATDAMYLMMKQAFELGYRRYEWKCDALNANSRAAALRLGFSYEGVFRQAAVVKGRNRDTAWYAAIDSEWPELARAFEQWLDPLNFDTAGRQFAKLSDLTRPILKKIG